MSSKKKDERRKRLWGTTTLE